MVIERRNGIFFAINIMSKRLKLALCILIPVAIIIAIIYFVLGFYVEEEPEVIVYPESGLSASIFDSQNTQYVPNESFSVAHSFSHMPYTIDTVPADGATIDTGSVYAAGDYYFFYSEIPKEQTMSECIRTQFSKVLKYDADDSSSTIETVKTGTGFLNGFAIEYHVEHLNVPQAEGAKDAYIIAYRLTISDDDGYPDDYDLIVATATVNLSNATLNACKELLDADVLTIQYDSTLANQLIDEKERADRKAAQEAEENGITEEAPPESEIPEASIEEMPVDEAAVEEGTIVEDTVPDQTEDISSDPPVYASSEPTVSTVSDGSDSKTMGVLLKKDYNDLSIIINWTNAGYTPQLTFSDVNGATEYQAESCSNGSALFHVGSVKAGVYIVNIVNGSQCGTFTSELIEN